MKKLKSSGLIVLLLAVFFISAISAHAALELRGTDSLGNRLIYDNDLDITWYDYTNYWDNWWNHRDWAASLTVNFGGTIYDDWRLPTTVDDEYVFGYNGITSGGYNIKNSEMGHLFYAELGNNGLYDKAGNLTGCSGTSPLCLTKTDVFQNLWPVYYWSGTEYADDTTGAWVFYMGEGYQYSSSEGYGGKGNLGYFGIAVRAGDVTVVPEPISSTLFVTGGILLIGRRYLRK